MSRSFVKFSVLGLAAGILVFGALSLMRPVSNAAVVQFFQGFETDNVWGDPPTDPTRVPSGTNGIPSKTGGFHAEVDGTGIGEFTRWGGYSSTFPANGYSTAIDIYLNMSGGYSNDTRFNWSSAINNTSGSHRRDFIFHGGFYNDAGPYGSGNRFVFSASNNSPGNPRDANRGPVSVSITGWYTLRHTFLAGTGGVLVVKLELINPTGTVAGTWSLSDASDIIGSTVGGNRYGWFPTASSAFQFPFLAIDNSQRVDLDPPDVINASFTHPLSNPNAWFIYNDETDTIDNSLGSLVNGPGTPPIGTGSAQISVTGSQRRNLATYQFSGTPLAAIASLRYSTYNPSAGNGGAADRAGYLQFNVDFNGSDTWQRRLGFVPRQNGTVLQDTWQEWDAINGGAAMWFYSGPTWPAGIGEPGTTPGTTLKSWNDILSTYPGVRMRVTDSFFGIRVGEPYASGYTENLDAIKITTPSINKHFNFDVLPPITYVDDDWTGTSPGTDPDGAGPATNFGYDAFATIQGGIDGVAVGGTVNVAAGTYNEGVHMNKNNVSLIGVGSGSSFIVGPHNSGGPDTLLITANNVVVDGFTITRSGNTVADWAGNVKNQGVRFSAPGTGSILQNSVVTGNRNGIYVGQSSNNHSIQRNVIDFNRTGIHMVDNNGPNLIEQNFITNNWTMGVLIRTEGGTQGLATVRNNNITGNWYSEIEYREPVSGGLQDFSGNYLGTTISRTTSTSGEPGYTSQIPVAYGGSAVAPPTHPTIAGPESAKVDYSPYLNFGGDTQPATHGFQGNFSSLSITSDGAQVGGTSRIQEAIDLISPGGVLTVPTATYPGNVDVNKAITVMGNFTVGGTFTVSSAGATVSPGLSPGIVNTGDFSLTSGSNLNIEINGNIAGFLYDQVNVSGTVSLGGANLVATLGYVPTPGHTYTIISNDGADAVTGTFAGLPEGSVFFLGAHSFQISYVGGTGNDVVLTSVAFCNTVSIPTNITTLTGNTNVLVPINVDDTTGHGLLSADFTVTYNPAVLTLTAVNLGSVTSGAVLTTNGTAGSMTVSIFQSAPFTGAGTLATLTFTAVGLPGTSSPVSFSSFTFNEGTQCLTTSNGLVSIISGTISGTVTYGNAIGSPAPPRFVPDVTLNAVGSVNTSATTGPVVSNGQYSLSGMGSGAYTVTPSKTGGVVPLTGMTITAFDSALIAQHVVSLITLNSTQLTVADVSGASGVTSFDAALIARWVAALPGSGSTGEWRFNPTSRNYANVNVDYAGEDYSALLMGDVSGNWHQGLSPARPMPGPGDDVPRLSAAHAKAGSGTEVIVPVTIDDLGKGNVLSYQFTLRYDPRVLEPVGDVIDVTGSLSDGRVVTVNSMERGVLVGVVFGHDPIEGAGRLFDLRFNVIGPAGSRTDLAWDLFFVNEGEIDLAIENGTVEVMDSSGTDVIKGRVLTGLGHGVPGARVILTDAAGNVRSVLADALGRFEIAGLTEGQTYTVRITDDRHRFPSQTVSLVGGTTSLDIIAIE